MKNCNLFGLNLTPTISTQKKSCKSVTYSFLCGKAGIRTLGTRKGTTVFETAPIDHSGTSPIISAWPFRFASAKLVIFFDMQIFLVLFLEKKSFFIRSDIVMGE